MDTQIKALVQLLCREEDPSNLDLVRRKLIDLGSLSVPLLKASLQQEPLMEPERITAVLQEIEWKNLGRQLQRWAERPQPGLEEGAFCVARFGYPQLELARYHRILDQMAEEARERLGPARSTVEAVGGLSGYLFGELGFRGNTVDYYDPDNSYINRVLDRKVGIPITLSVVLLLVTQRLGFPVVGVGLPGHFVARYEGLGQEIYIDAFNQGRLLSREDCAHFLRNSGYGEKEAFFVPSTPTQILARMMRNLIFIYQRRRESQRVKWLTHYVDLLSVGAWDESRKEE